MKLFVSDKKFEDSVRRSVRNEIKKIQATEGGQDQLEMESLLTGTTISGNTDGCNNNYKTYSAQTSAIFKKYDNRQDLGSWQTRALVDTRTAFISGEGLSVHASKKKTSEWIEKFLLYNKLKGSRFFEFVKAGEMLGKGLFTLHADRKNNQVLVKRVPDQYEGGQKKEYIPVDIGGLSNRVDIYIDNKPSAIKNFQYVKIHGLPYEYNSTTTKVGLCLNHCDNYDRGLNAMRKNNHLFGKITPFFECDDESTVSKITKIIKAGWKIGDAIAAKKAKLHLVIPDLGAMENIKQELYARAKAISFETGIPVHWLGDVELMSNRSTADSLYETINNGTVNERAIWAEAFYEIIIKAQEIAINAGLEGAPDIIDADFEVKIPLVSFTRMLQYVQAISLAFNDGAISLADYTNMLPGVDPLRVKQNKAEEAKAEAKATEQLIKKTKLPDPEEEEDNNNGKGQTK